MTVRAEPVQLSQQAMRAWMQRLLNRAERVGSTGEIPVAAVLLDEVGRCIGHGSNRRETAGDPLGHAELIALRQGAWVLGDWRMNHCTLLVSLEPCPMCAGALVQARVGQVIFAARDSKRGGLGSTINLADHESAHHHMRVVGGVMEEEASALLADWFKRRRRRPHGSWEARSQTD